MKNFKILLTVFLIVILTSMKPVKKIKILFFGDSITQMGIDKGGFIDRINNELEQKHLQNKYQLIGAGIGSNKVYDLYLRMPEDVLSKKPNIVVVWIGVNDVWHKKSYGTGTDRDKFEKFYAALIKKMQEKKIKLVLTTPATIGEKYDKTNEQDKELDAYSDVIRKLALEFSCKLVDLRAIFMEYEKEHNTGNKESGILTTDGVHLNPTGNQLVADEMWKVLIQ